MGSPAGSERFVEIDVMAPDPDRPGYLRLVRRKTIREVFDEIRAITGDNPTGEYFGITSVVDDRIAAGEWPHGRIAVFAVTGRSEGHYIHADVIDDRRYIPVLTAKTFDGWDAAWALAKQLARILCA